VINESQPSLWLMGWIYHLCSQTKPVPSLVVV
jgi:hypothetical protein